MSDEAPQQFSAGERSRRLTLGEWGLVALGAAGLAGVAFTFGFVINQSITTVTPERAQAAVPEPGTTTTVVGAKGDPGPRGERGPPGPAGPRGDPGIRILRQDCPGGNCDVRCEEDEVMIAAFCGIGRTPAVLTSDTSAICRSRSTARVQVVAACVKSR